MLQRRILPARYDDRVFINCALDAAFRPIFEAIVFAIHDCGFVARSAIEIIDAGEVRVDKIMRLIASCRYGVHDISRIEPDQVYGLPQFNMPFELGLFLGAKRYGNRAQRQKRCLVFDRDHYRYQKFLSDIAGQDIAAHEGSPQKAIKRVRDWLRTVRTHAIELPAGEIIARRYRFFVKQLPQIAKRLHLTPKTLTFSDFVAVVEEWLAANELTAG